MLREASPIFTALKKLKSFFDVLIVNGHGYPDGLAGERIPLGARIVSVCDAYRAMIERRTYREPLTEREALRELRDNAGTQFDPECVRALLAVLTARQAGGRPVPLHRPAHAA